MHRCFTNYYHDETHKLLTSNNTLNLACLADFRLCINNIIHILY